MTRSTDSTPRDSAPLDRLREWLDRSPFTAVVVGRPGNVGWLTRGSNAPIDRTAPFDPVWLVVDANEITVVTTNVETARVRAELMIPGAAEVQFAEVNWWEADHSAAALRVIGESASEIASDALSLGTDVSQQLTALRMCLDEVEQASLLQLGRESSIALEEALAEWTPGDTDFSVLAAISARLEAAGIQAPVLIVGGDERLESYRHPLAIGAPMHRRVMAVAVARRLGLHVALTRYADAEPPSAELAAAMTDVRAIDASLLERMTPGSTYGAALEHLADAYAAAGHPEAWREHYQGGPIGFEQREFEIAPTDTGSPWFSEVVRVGHAIAFNPSLSGGAKVEDTYLITGDGLLLVTDSGLPVSGSTDTTAI